MSVIETIERTVTETRHGWSVQLRFADHHDFDAAKNAILIRAKVDVPRERQRGREVLLEALGNVRELIDREIEALRVGLPLKPL